jgi:hypothetical protein
MNETTRHLVLKVLDCAHEAAVTVLEPHLAKVTPEERATVTVTIEALRACLQNQGGLGEDPEDLARQLRRLEGTVANPRCLQLVQQYSGYLNDFLCSTRDELLRPTRTGDN